MFRLIDPFRIDYYQIEHIIEIMATLRGQDFYDEELFYFLEGLSRYSTETQLKKLLPIVEAIIDQYYNKL